MVWRKCNEIQNGHSTFYLDTLRNLYVGLARLKVDREAFLLGGRISPNYQVAGHTDCINDSHSAGCVIKCRDCENNPLHPRSLNGLIVYYRLTQDEDNEGNLRPRIYLQKALRQEFKTRRLITITPEDGVSLIFEPSKRKLLGEQKAQWLKNHKKYTPTECYKKYEMYED